MRQDLLNIIQLILTLAYSANALAVGFTTKQVQAAKRALSDIDKLSRGTCEDHEAGVIRGVCFGERGPEGGTGVVDPTSNCLQGAHAEAPPQSAPAIGGARERRALGRWSTHPCDDRRFEPACLVKPRRLVARGCQGAEPGRFATEPTAGVA